MTSTTELPAGSLIDWLVVAPQDFTLTLVDPMARATLYTLDDQENRSAVDLALVGNAVRLSATDRAAVVRLQPATTTAVSAGSLIGLAGKCLDVAGGDPTSGTPIQLWDCNGFDPQKWSYDGVTIRGLAGKCVDVQWSNSASGAPIQLWDCNGTDAQKWTYDGSLFRGLGGKCLDVRGGDPASGARLQLWDGLDPQRWTFAP